MWYNINPLHTSQHRGLGSKVRGERGKGREGDGGREGEGEKERETEGEGGGEREREGGREREMHCFFTLPLQITFSPLFAICNHLPFDLTMIAKTITEGSSAHSMLECVLEGKGHKVHVCDLAADCWYHLHFKQRYILYRYIYMYTNSCTTGYSSPAVLLKTHYFRQIFKWTSTCICGFLLL